MFLSAAKPENETERLARLHAMCVLDTDPEDIFDALTRAAADLCEAPIALVTLVDEDRQWFKSAVGTDMRETPRNLSLCAHVVVAEDLIEIPDTSADSRFAGHPMVTGPTNVQFYAGAPISLSDGFTLGSLCVVDHVPRKLADHQLKTLRHLASVAAQALESRAKAADALALADQAQDRILDLYRCTPAALFSMDGDGRLMIVSDAWTDELGYSREELEGHHVGEFLTPASRRFAIEVGIPKFREEGRTANHEYQMVCKDGALIDVSVSQVLERDAEGRPLRSMSVFQNITPRKQAERALRDEQARMARILEGTNAGTWELNVVTRETRYNERWAEIIGYTLEELQPTTADRWAAMIHPEDLPRALQQVTLHYEGVVEEYDFEGRIRHKDGRWIWVRDHARVSERDATGRPLWMHGTHADITSRKQAEGDLARNRELLQVTLESIGDAVVTTDTNGVVQWLNPVAERMTGWPRDEAVGRLLDEVFVIVDEETRAPAQSPVATCLASSQNVAMAGHVTLISRDGVEFGIEDSASPIREANGQVLGAVLVFHDVSEQRRLNRELSHRATHDPLTGLLNRTEFEARLAQVLANEVGSGASHTLLYIDLDQFKFVNDACGHSAGDQLLRQVSGILRGCVRGLDLLARLGGDEFGLVLRQCDVHHGQRVAQKICDQMEDFRFVHDGRRFRVGTSIGLVPVDSRWSNMKSLLQAADASCYAAKEGGRNRVHAWFDSDKAMKARQGDMQWVSRLELALDENRFVLYGQRIEPIDDMPHGLHFEVLLRMREPNGTLVPPGAFLPAAERFHLATRIDRWVVRRAFDAMRRASANHVDVEMMAINLSGQSLGDRAFHRDVCDMIRRATFDTGRLCFEITETAAITHMADARTFIDEVRTLGVKVALDDFGAGASSFGYLKSLPVDFLKIDGHFITNLLEDELNNAAVRCFCEVAKVVGVKTIAEFVEREDVRAELRTIGVDMAQGYLVHRPEPLARLFAQHAAIDVSLLSTDLVGAVPVWQYG